MSKSLFDYMSAPVLSWNVMLNITKVEVDFVSDVDMYLFLEKGIRSGLSF